LSLQPVEDVLVFICLYQDCVYLQCNFFINSDGIKLSLCNEVHKFIDFLDYCFQSMGWFSCAKISILYDKYACSSCTLRRVWRTMVIRVPWYLNPIPISCLWQSEAPAGGREGWCQLKEINLNHSRLTRLPEGNIQLKPGTTLLTIAGIVRVYHNGEWGTVCHNYWDMREAKVACRQLGFTKAVGYWWYGRGSGKVWLYNMRCTGTETSLHSCSHIGWGKVASYCNSHTNDVRRPNRLLC